MEKEQYNTMKIDKYAEILGEWNKPSGVLVDMKRVLSMDEHMKDSEIQEDLIVYIQVRDVKKTPILAEIRCYPLPEGSWCGELDGTDRRIEEAYQTGNLEFIRTMTDELGYAALFLQPGWYQIEVAKGSGYSVEAKRIHLEKTQTILQYTLRELPSGKKDGWYAGDIHHHSVFSSRLYGGTDPVVETPVQVRDSMRAAGLDFGALSDHHNVLDHDLWAETETDDFTPILSKEISTSNGHVISLNVKKNADVIYRVPEPEDRTDEYLRSEFIRITDEIRSLGGMPQLDHPRDPQTAISWNPDFMDIVTIFETIEIWNGSKPMVQGSSSAEAVGMWVDLLEKGIYIPGTTGSDTHNIRCNDYMCFYRDTRNLVQKLRELKEDDPLAEDLDVKGFLKVCDTLLPIFEKWAKRNLSSGGVRTFVHVDMDENTKITPDRIVEQMKQGHMTLSDGPMLFPVMYTENGTEYLSGDLAKQSGSIEVKLLTNRRLRTMRILKKERKIAEYSLVPYEVQKDGYMDYSHTLTAEMLEKMGIGWKKEDYLILAAFDDCTNVAITNPFRIG